VIEGLVYLHALNIFHRDIKMENVLICADGRIKIIDFGFGVLAEPQQKLYVFCGTPKYMAPEILQNQQYLGGAADV